MMTLLLPLHKLPWVSFICLCPSVLSLFVQLSHAVLCFLLTCSLWWKSFGNFCVDSGLVQGLRSLNLQNFHWCLRHQSLWVMIAPHAPTCTPYPAGFGLCHARMHIRTLSFDVCIEVAWVCVRCTLGRLDGNGRVRSREPALGQREAWGVAGGERALVGVSGRSFGDRSSNSSLIKTCDASQVRFPRELMQEHRFIQACKESSLKIHLLSLIHRTLVP